MGGNEGGKKVAWLALGWALRARARKRARQFFYGVQVALAISTASVASCAPALQALLAQQVVLESLGWVGVGAHPGEAVAWSAGAAVVAFMACMVLWVDRSAKTTLDGEVAVPLLMSGAGAGLACWALWARGLFGVEPVAALGWSMALAAPGLALLGRRVFGAELAGFGSATARVLEQVQRGWAKEREDSQDIKDLERSLGFNHVGAFACEMVKAWTFALALLPALALAVGFDVAAFVAKHSARCFAASREAWSSASVAKARAKLDGVSLEGMGLPGWQEEEAKALDKASRPAEAGPKKPNRL
jgi:hypothetical protein